MKVACRLRNVREQPCEWIGSRSALLDHCAQEHKYSVSVSRGGLAWRYKKIFTETVNLMWDDKELFWCHHRDQDGVMYWTASHIKSSADAPDYYYTVDCYLSGNHSKKMILQEVCLPHETDLELIFNTRRCVAMPYNALKMYFSIGDFDILDQIIFTANIKKFM